MYTVCASLQALAKSGTCVGGRVSQLGPSPATSPAPSSSSPAARRGRSAEQARYCRKTEVKEVKDDDDTNDDVNKTNAVNKELLATLEQANLALIADARAVSGTDLEQDSSSSDLSLPSPSPPPQRQQRLTRWNSLEAVRLEEPSKKALGGIQKGPLRHTQSDPPRVCEKAVKTKYSKAARFVKTYLGLSQGGNKKGDESSSHKPGPVRKIKSLFAKEDKPGYRVTVNPREFKQEPSESSIDSFEHRESKRAFSSSASPAQPISGASESISAKSFYSPGQINKSLGQCSDVTGQKTLPEKEATLELDFKSDIVAYHSAKEEASNDSSSDSESFRVYAVDYNKDDVDGANDSSKYAGNEVLRVPDPFDREIFFEEVVQDNLREAAPANLRAEDIQRQSEFNCKSELDLKKAQRSTFDLLNEGTIHSSLKKGSIRKQILNKARRRGDVLKRSFKGLSKKKSPEKQRKSLRQLQEEVQGKRNLKGFDFFIEESIKLPPTDQLDAFPKSRENAGDSPTSGSPLDPSGCQNPLDQVGLNEDTGEEHEHISEHQLQSRRGSSGSSFEIKLSEDAITVEQFDIECVEKVFVHSDNDRGHSEEERVEEDNENVGQSKNPLYVPPVTSAYVGLRKKKQKSLNHHSSGSDSESSKAGLNDNSEKKELKKSHWKRPLGGKKRPSTSDQRHEKESSKKTSTPSSWLNKTKRLLPGSTSDLAGANEKTLSSDVALRCVSLVNLAVKSFGGERNGESDATIASTLHNPSTAVKVSDNEETIEQEETVLAEAKTSVGAADLSILGHLQHLKSSTEEDRPQSGPSRRSSNARRVSCSNTLETIDENSEKSDPLDDEVFASALDTPPEERREDVASLESDSTFKDCDSIAGPIQSIGDDLDDLNADTPGNIQGAGESPALNLSQLEIFAKATDAINLGELSAEPRVSPHTSVPTGVSKSAPDLDQLEPPGVRKGLTKKPLTPGPFLRRLELPHWALQKSNSLPIAQVLSPDFTLPRARCRSGGEDQRTGTTAVSFTGSHSEKLLLKSG